MSWSAIFSFLSNIIKSAVLPLLAWKTGKDSEKQKNLEVENEILKKQRDNNVTSFNDAISVHKKRGE